MRRIHVQAGTLVVGVALIGWGIYNSIGISEWNMWSALVTFGPVGLGVVFALPGPTKKTLDILAPKLPFLHDHDDDA